MKQVMYVRHCSHFIFASCLFFYSSLFSFFILRLLFKRYFFFFLSLYFSLLPCFPSLYLPSHFQTFFFIFFISSFFCYLRILLLIFSFFLFFPHLVPALLLSSSPPTITHFSRYLRSSFSPFSSFLLSPKHIR